MSEVLLGKPIRAAILAEIQERIKSGEVIKGYVILNPASFEAAEYMKLVTKLLTQLEIATEVRQISDSQGAQAAIQEANRDPDGEIFLCRPLLLKDEKELIELIEPYKDADMLTSSNIGKLTKGDLDYLSGTSSSVRKIIDFYNLETKGKKTLVIGRSISVGMPAALLMIKKDALVSVVHSKIPRETIGKLASESDIVILASGQRGLVLPEEIRSHQVIIDCGYQDDGKGDLGFVPDCAAYTPVPGGVGPVTIACLVENALRLHSKQK